MWTSAIRLIERFYYSSQYMIASASREGKVARDSMAIGLPRIIPSWNGDYTLNYNHETPFLALYASNHIGVAGSFEQPVLDIVPRAKQYARTILGVRGILYPGTVTWGYRTPFDYDPFMGQKQWHFPLPEHPHEVLQHLRHGICSADLSVSFGSGQFLGRLSEIRRRPICGHNDCIGEVGPWKAYAAWDACGEGTENTWMNYFLRSTYKGLIDVSTELGVDVERRSKWQHILDHLSPYPTWSEMAKSSSGAPRIARYARGRVPGSSGPQDRSGQQRPEAFADCSGHRIPRGYNPHPMAPPALARLGFNPNALLEGMRKQVGTAAYPNGYIFSPAAEWKQPVRSGSRQ